MDNYTFADFQLAAKNRGFNENTEQVRLEAFQAIKNKGYNPAIHKRYFVNKSRSAQVVFDKERILIVQKGKTLWQGTFTQLWDAANHLP